MEQAFTLDMLQSGQSALISELLGSGAMRTRLCDLGFTKMTLVTCLFPSAFGDPKAYRVKDTVVALRRADARNVLCRACGGGR